MSKEIYIKVSKNGPYLVYGHPKMNEQHIITDNEGVSIQYSDGEIYHIKEEPAALCRCGQSEHAPFCDGTHEYESWDGTEEASFDEILRNAVPIEGPNYTLMDNESYCAFARFCDADGQIWNLVTIGNEKTDERAVQEACDCPSGRLIMFKNGGDVIEPDLEKEISPLEDGGLHISGPLWIKGGIRIESESGRSYEIRNRQTLCRCGHSVNKPFCNGAHASVKFIAHKA